MAANACFSLSLSLSHLFIVLFYDKCTRQSAAIEKARQKAAATAHTAKWRVVKN